MKKVFTLLTKTLLVAVCLLGGTSSAWADDYTLGSSKFNSAKTIATVNDLDFTLSNAHGGSGQTGYSEYIKFSKNSTYTITLPEGFSLTNINIKGYTNSNGKTNGEITSVGGNAQTGKTFPAKDNASLASETAITTGYDFAISQKGGSVAIATANTNQICVLITLTGTAAAPVAVDPVFSLSSPISLSGEGQIKVGTKDDLDGITLSSITYTKSGVVTVDEDGVVTPVAKGTTTINFNSSAVTGKYNASEGNSLTVTVIEPIAVFDASAANAEFVLTKTNIKASENEFVSVSTEDWAERTPAPYTKSNYYNLSGTGRYITFKASGASTFQIVIQNGSGSADRKYTVKIGEGEDVDITAAKNSVTSSPVFATGTTGEVTIKIIGTSDGSLYPAAIKFNPTVSITPAKTYTTLTSAYALDFTSVSSDLEAYIATAVAGGSVQMTQVNKVPAGTGLVLKATTPESAVNVPVFDGTSPDDVSGNKMVGSATETTAIAANGGYILKDGVFQPALAGTLPAGKAYLNVAVSSAPVLNLNFGDATGIESIAKSQELTANGQYYNLNGQRVAQPTKGLYIVNGKKVIIK